MGRITSENARAMNAARKTHNGGRKRKEEEQSIKDALHAVMPTSEVLEQLAEAVRNKQYWAIQLYLAYDWGKPTENIKTDVTTNGERLAIGDQELVSELARIFDVARKRAGQSSDVGCEVSLEPES